MNFQRRIGADPARLATFIYKGYTDWHVRLLVGEECHFLTRLVVELDPRFFHCNGVNVTGLDFVKCRRIDASEAHNHLVE